MEILLKIKIASLRYSMTLFVNVGLNCWQPKIVVNSFFIEAVQEPEINEFKSLGPSSIREKILKSHVDGLKQLLAYLIHLSFQ